jgi:hypothetical protein
MGRQPADQRRALPVTALHENQDDLNLLPKRGDTADQHKDAVPARINRSSNAAALVRAPPAFGDSERKEDEHAPDPTFSCAPRSCAPRAGRRRPGPRGRFSSLWEEPYRARRRRLCTFAPSGPPPRRSAAAVQDKEAVGRGAHRRPGARGRGGADFQEPCRATDQAACGAARGDWKPLNKPPDRHMTGQFDEMFAARRLR